VHLATASILAAASCQVHPPADVIPMQAELAIAHV